jgi:hypothetical protein
MFLDGIDLKVSGVQAGLSQLYLLITRRSMDSWLMNQTCQRQGSGDWARQFERQGVAVLLVEHGVAGIGGKAGLLVKRGSRGTIVNQVNFGNGLRLFVLVLCLCVRALCCRACGAVGLFANGVVSEVLTL